ncbi:unnamed protein product [Orchesella dallaii]|uniref:Uncharacterized protein n=1 Tax=Orchesella dallaii TaxID=48710 RepID=A0ABP1PV66_9HEXA
MDRGGKLIHRSVLRTIEALKSYHGGKNPREWVFPCAIIRNSIQSLLTCENLTVPSRLVQAEINFATLQVTSTQAASANHFLFQIILNLKVIKEDLERLVRAIESIPAQIQQVYRHQNHQFNQLRPVLDDDDDDEAEIHRRNMNPYLQQSPAPNKSAAPSSSQHPEIEMEQERNDDDREYSSSKDDDLEVLPQAGIISKCGRIIRRPNFFRY